MSKKNPPTESSSHDIAWGVKSIAAEINAPPGRVYYLISKNLLPIKKHGHRMISASRAALRRAVAADNSEIT
jgi:hypothetical protein